MQKSVSCCLIVLVLAMSGLAFPLSEVEAANVPDDQHEVPLHADDSWTLSIAESRYLFSPRLRANGNEALRNGDTIYLAFGNKERIDAFRMQVFSTEQIVIYKQANQTYEQIKCELGSRYFLTQRKRMERSCVKHSSLS